MRALTMRLAVLLVGVAGFALPASAGAQAPASLVGEALGGSSTTLQITGASCDAQGNSTINFHVTGGAFGPYPGTFDETGTITIGAQNLPEGTGSGLGFSSGPVLVAHTSFTINSAAGQVTGTKDLSTVLFGDATNTGLCVENNTGSEFLQNLCAANPTSTGPQSLTAYRASVSATYQASLPGNNRDTGSSKFDLSSIRYLCSTDVGGGQIVGGTDTFAEFFLVSNGVVPINTPGKATGGGQINSDVSFGFTAFANERQDGSLDIQGHCNVVQGKTKVRCRDVTQYSQVGNQATFAGSAEVNGILRSYRIEVQDNSDSGIGADRFTITTDGGFSATGVLTAGNVQVHQTASPLTLVE